MKTTAGARSGAVLFFALHFGAAYASDYASCILDRMPGSANNAITIAVTQTCARENPGAYYQVERGSGLGFFGYNDAQACILKKAKDTTEQRAAMLIAVACRCLYDTPTFKGEMCGYPPVQMSYTPVPVEEPITASPSLPPATRAPLTVAPVPPAAAPAPTPVVRIYASPAAKPAKPLKPALNEIRKTDQDHMPDAQAIADLNFIAARAIDDFPVLGTLEGTPLMEKIIARRDQLMWSGMYPSVALTQAVNEVMPSYLPAKAANTSPDQQRAIIKPAPVAQNGCRWTSLKDWTCN